MNKAFDSIPDISFIDNMSLEELQTKMITWYQDRYKELTGNEKILARTDPERLKLYTCALVLYQALQFIDARGKSNLLRYSYGDYLDNIGAWRGVLRNRGTRATTTLRFTLSGVRPSAVTIPKGTRMSADGWFFRTKEFAEIPIGSLTVDVPAECSEVGVAANGYMAGDIKTLVDPLPYVAKAENITPTANGTDVESDDAFAERIFLAPSAFSVAGPDDAYKYFVRECSPDVDDVNVTSPTPGMVDIRIVLKGGTLPDDDLKNKIKNYLTDKQRKPLTDNVFVDAPKIDDYTINVAYYINESDKATATMIQSQVSAAVEEYKVWQGSKIGRDIIPSELIKRMVLAGAKRVEVMQPKYTVVSPTNLAHCTGVTVTYGGVEDD